MVLEVQHTFESTLSQTCIEGSGDIFAVNSLFITYPSNLWQYELVLFCFHHMHLRVHLFWLVVWQVTERNVVHNVYIPSY